MALIKLEYEIWLEQYLFKKEIGLDSSKTYFFLFVLVHVYTFKFFP